MPSTPTYGGAHATAPVETSTSGRIEVGANNSRTYIAEGKYSLLLAALPVLNSLTTGSDPVGAGYSPIGATLEKEGDKGLLTITYRPIFPSTSVGGGGGGSGSFPADTWDLKPFTEQVPLERHPKFTALTAAEKKWWKIAFGTGGDEAAVEEALNWIAFNASSDGGEFYNLKLDGHDTYPVTCWNYIWTHHEIFVPYVSDGNLIETPYGPGSPFLGGGLTWKRSADDLHVDPGHSTVIRSWEGVPTRLLATSQFLFT